MNPASRMHEFWNLLRARLALLAGSASKARIALKGTLRLNPNSFTAHFLLGRLYWREQETLKARREFDLAWQIDPERFERAYARMRAQQAEMPDLFAAPTEGGRGVPVPRHPRVRELGDFRDERERRRFASLPPITRDEILQIDWDRFEEQIHRE